MTDNKYLVGAYERLSKEDDKKDESSSIESQKMIIESFAKFNQLKIIKHLVMVLQVQILIDRL
ncbi:MAG: hypothetical protein ACLRQF_10655 [Thomasclavelia ramosa]